MKFSRFLKVFTKWRLLSLLQTIAFKFDKSCFCLCRKCRHRENYSRFLCHIRKIRKITFSKIYKILHLLNTVLQKVEIPSGNLSVASKVSGKLALHPYFCIFE